MCRQCNGGIGKSQLCLSGGWPCEFCNFIGVKSNLINYFSSKLTGIEPFESHFLFLG